MSKKELNNRINVLQSVFDRKINLLTEENRRLQSKTDKLSNDLKDIKDTVNRVMGGLSEYLSVEIIKTREVEHSFPEGEKIVNKYTFNKVDKKLKSKKVKKNGKK